jgi:hypothetical protein
MTRGERCPSYDRHRLERTEVSPEISAASVAVLGERLPVDNCSCGHIEIPAELGRAARRACADALPAADRRPLRTDVCRSCRTPLTMPARRTTRAVTVSTTSLPAVTLRFDLPMTRCPDCGLDQLPHRARHDVVVALAALFQAAADEVSGDDAIDPQELGPLERLNYTLRRHQRR